MLYILSSTFYKKFLRTKKAAAQATALISLFLGFIFFRFFLFVFLMYLAGEIDAALFINFDDFDSDFIADFDDVLDFLNALFR